jgi:hypothetical protein
MADTDKEILSAELLYSEDEILTEFWEGCEQAAETPGASTG